MSEARDKIIKTASRLFYEPGYRATGINQIIEESGVAKATFYSHFPSKEDLGIADVKRTSDAEFALLDSLMQRRRTAETRFMLGIEILKEWLVETQFRGCSFLNIATEFHEVDNAIRQGAEQLYERYRSRLVALSQELVDSDKVRYGHLKSVELAERYLTIFAGTLALCTMFKSIEPYHRGVKMVRTLIEEG